MAYQALARKYRPSSFFELVGQEAVSQALANAIRLRREPHAVVFSGVRGIGKTTTARLYAKSLNCEKGPTPEPCNVCASCLAITKGNHEDVLEIDGASNTGVGDVRALQETIEYVPQRSKFKVYIIDEVHMLSQAAFNALLKTLEEPPSHVVFVFATTELNRVPQTIISRCQAFNLQKLSLGLIRQRLVDILQKEAIPFEEKAVAIIAREGHGSMRDALTLLDQAIALGDGHLNLTSLGSLVSNLSSSPYLDLIAAMTQKDAQAALKVIATLDQSGAEFASVVEETAKFARHGFVIKDLGKKALDTALLGLDDDEVARLNDIALAAPAFDLNRIFRTLCRCRAELDGSAIDRFVLENYVFEWCLDPGLPDLTSLIESQGDLGIKMGAKIGTKSAAVNTAPAAKVAPAPVAISPVASGLGVSDSHASAKAAPQRMRDVMAEIKAPAAKPQVPLMHRAGAALGEVASATTSAATPPLDSPTSIATLPGSWRQLVDAWKLCKPLQARKLEEVHPITFTPTLITIAVSDDGFASKSLLQKDEQNKILEQFRELFGFKGQLSVVAAGPATEASSVLPSAPNLINVSEVRAGGSKQEFAAKLSQEPPIFSDDPSVEEIPHSEGPLDPLLPDTLLTVKEREGAERRQKMLASAREAGLTQEVLAVFNASIEDVTIRE